MEAGTGHCVSWPLSAAGLIVLVRNQDACLSVIVTPWLKGWTKGQTNFSSQYNGQEYYAEVIWSYEKVFKKVPGSSACWSWGEESQNLNHP